MKIRDLWFQIALEFTNFTIFLNSLKLVTEFVETVSFQNGATPIENATEYASYGALDCGILLLVLSL
jgi:hypothetical protein